MKSKKEILITFLLFILLFQSCASSLKLDISISKSCFKDGKEPLTLYVLSESVFDEIVELKKEYKRRTNSLISQKDSSLEKMKNQFSNYEKKLLEFENRYNLIKTNYPNDYLRNIKIRPIRFQRIGNLCQLWIKIFNYGDAHIDSLQIAVYSEQDTLSTNISIREPVTADNIIIYKKIYFDISNNKELLDSVTMSFIDNKNILNCKATRVYSNFEKNLNPLKNEIKTLKNKLLALAIEIETFSEIKKQSINNSVILPINNIIANKLEKKSMFKAKIKKSGLVRYHNLDKGLYFIFLIENQDSPRQFYSDITLMKKNNRVRVDETGKTRVFINNK